MADKRYTQPAQPLPENMIEGRNALTEALKSGRTIDKVYVADGDTRKIEKPKKKRARHLFVTEETISSLQEKLEAGAPVENCELRKALKALRQKEE